MKLGIGHSVEQDVAGSGTSPDRTEAVWKCENQIDRLITMDVFVSTGNMKAGSYAVLYGAQRPTITHSNGNTIAELQGENI